VVADWPKGGKMKIGPNDPCRCGSGKKYKKCCLFKEEATPAAEPTASPEPAAAPPKLERSRPLPEPEPEPPPPDPHIEALGARWKEFEAAEYEGQLELFVKTVDEPELMDAQMSFDMIDRLYHETLTHGERDRFDALVEMLHERLPEVYAEHAHYFLDWRITNAVATGRYEIIPPLAREMAHTAAKDIDVFNWSLDRLAYHGQLSPLLEMMRLAWPSVKKSRDILPWGIDEFAQRACSYVIFEYVEHQASPDGHDPNLIEQLEFYHQIVPERLVRYLGYLTGQVERQWTISDFKLSRGRSQPDADSEQEPAEEQGDQNLYDLTVEFLGHLHREHGVSYTKGELGRKQILEYLRERHTGELEPTESLFQAQLGRKKGKQHLKPKHRVDHLLCPDRETLDRYLGGLLQFINPQHYKATATFELVPAWLRFLESRQLIDDEQRAKTLLELRPLSNDLLKVLRLYRDDPTLEAAVQRWQDEAGS
jgi:hypothetical protein